MGGNRVKGQRKAKGVKAKVTYNWGSKRRLSRMGKEAKRGHAGISANYVTRAQAIRRLQLTLKDFRRLCILKGIYPRDPKRKANGKDKSYYHLKDVAFLAHEPLIESFREFKAFMKKLRRSAGRRELSEARRRWASRPTYSLDHLIRERYPRFVDALRDLDDALSLVHLFAALPQMRNQTSHRTEGCRRIVREWQLYVAQTGCLSKVFVSIKGVYCQALIQGQPVTWVQPHQFTQHYPQDVDFRVMLTFLEFYEVLLKFVLFKLYSTEGLRYPPLLDESLDASDAGILALRAHGAGGPQGVLLQSSTSQETPGGTGGADVRAVDMAIDSKQAKESERRIKSLERRLGQIVSHDAESAAAAAELDGADVFSEDAAASAAAASGGGGPAAGDGDPSAEDDALELGEALTVPLAAALRGVGADDVPGGGVSRNGTSVGPEPADGGPVNLNEFEERMRQRRLFQGLRFFLGREVPRHYLTFMIASQGGVVGWDGEGSPISEGDAKITHQIVDRPSIQGDVKARREYVQPQWVFDSINARMLLPVERYAVGASLPPHLSPFVDDAEVGYVPAYREELQRLAAAAATVKGSGSPAAAAVLGGADPEAEPAAGSASAREEGAEEAAYANELRLEASGTTFSEAAAKEKGAAKRRRGLSPEDGASEAEDDASRSENGAAHGADGGGSGDEATSKVAAGGDRDEAQAGSRRGSAGKEVRFAASARTSAEEEHDLRKLVMGKKSKRLYSRMQHGLGKKKEAAEKLKEKRAAIEKKYEKAAPAKKRVKR